MTEVYVSMPLQKLVEKLKAIKKFVAKCQFNRMKHHDDQHYFYDQVSDHPFEVLHRSKHYESMQSVNPAISAVLRDAPLAPIIHSEDREL